MMACACCLQSLLRLAGWQSNKLATLPPTWQRKSTAGLCCSTEALMAS